MKLTAVMGSPNSGKTSLSVRLAEELSREQKNVIIVFCDPYTPSIPTLLPASAEHDISIGELLTSPALTQRDILKACVPVPGNDRISVLGYRFGENLMRYPEITSGKAVEFFVMLRYLADYIIIDCASVFEADRLSIVAIEVADKVFSLGTADLRGISYHHSHEALLSDSKFRRQEHVKIIGNVRMEQEWEAAAQQYKGVSYVLPYVLELEKKYNELELFAPMTAKESAVYTAQVQKLIAMVTGSKAAENKKQIPAQQMPIQQVSIPEKKPEVPQKGAFALPFGKRKGEF